MVRFVLDIEEINIDNVKLPMIPGIGMLKNLPNHQKFSMLVNVINSQKAQFLPKIEEEAAKRWGYIHITDLSAEMPTDGICYLRFRFDLTDADYDRAIDTILPSIFQVDDIDPVLGASYTGPATVSDAIQFMHQADTAAKKEFYLVKTLSTEKSTIIESIETGAAAQGALLRISALRFLMPQQA